MSIKMNHLQYLTEYEAEQIMQQFSGPAFLPNRQVLWTGLLRAEAQQWADKHKMQTLSTAMGPLMTSEQKPEYGWSNYIKGASLLFAQRIAMGETVVVLCAPPPIKLHPSGLTNYQTLEEPVLMGRLGLKTVSCIYMCHPAVFEAEEYCYEAWPSDNTHKWVEKYGSLAFKSRIWRQVRLKAPIANHKPLTSCDTVVCLPDQGAAGGDTQRQQLQEKTKHQLPGKHDTAMAGNRFEEANEMAKKMLKKAKSATANFVGQMSKTLEGQKVAVEKTNKAKKQSKTAKKRAIKVTQEVKKPTMGVKKAKKKSNKVKEQVSKNATNEATKAAKKAKEATTAATMATKKANEATIAATNAANKAKEAMVAATKAANKAKEATMAAAKATRKAKEAMNNNKESRKAK